MVVISIEDANGQRNLGAIKVHDDGDGEFKDVETLNMSFADVEFDEFFDSNEFQLRIWLDKSTAFRSMNHDSVGHVPDECKQLVKEYNSYKALLKYFKKQAYYDCYIMIANYFGHIDYWAEFGYLKTHDEICCILFECLLSSLDPQHANDRFEDFVNRMMKKIEWNLKNNHNYEIENTEE